MTSNLSSLTNNRRRGVRAYSSKANRADLRRRGIKAVIPEKTDQAAARKRKGSDEAGLLLASVMIWIRTTGHNPQNGPVHAPPSAEQIRPEVIDLLDLPSLENPKSGVWVPHVTKADPENIDDIARLLEGIDRYYG